MNDFNGDSYSNFLEVIFLDLEKIGFLGGSNIKRCFIATIISPLIFFLVGQTKKMLIFLATALAIVLKNQQFSINVSNQSSG